MNKEIKIIEISLDGSVNLIPHPKQSEIYDDEIDKEFLESVKLHGVRQMPTVAIADVANESIEPEKDNYVIVSGHRRIGAAQQTNMKSILCELKDYNSNFEMELDHIILNKQRKKKSSEISAELNAYKQKLDHIRNIYENEGIEGLQQLENFRVEDYLTQDENGELYLPYTRKIIKDHLGITEHEQKIRNVIDSDNWLDDKVELISLSSLSKRKKKEAIEKFSKLVLDARKEADKEDGISLNKLHKEIMRVWNDIDSVINPKPKTKNKRKNITKKWLKAKDLVIDPSKVTVDAKKTSYTYDKELIHVSEKNGKDYFLSVDKLIKFLKEQGV